MDGYKKIIRSQKARMTILKALSFIPDKMMIRLQYWIKLKRKLNLKDPQRYTEKLQWYKLYYHNPIMTICVDKNRVRDYIIEQGFAELLPQRYQTVKKPEEIKLEELPNTFIIKTANGSGTNIICTDKSTLSWNHVLSELNEYIKRPKISAGREWAYNNVENTIIVEELLQDPDNPYGGINDYKFICFAGDVYCIVVDVGRFTDHGRNFYTPGWKRINAVSDHKNFEPDISKPKNLDEMLRIAQKLSKPFPHVRVDLYNINGEIYFGEMTFYPWSGYVQYTPDSFDFDIGKHFKIERYLE